MNRPILTSILLMICIVLFAMVLWAAGCGVTGQKEPGADPAPAAGTAGAGSPDATTTETDIKTETAPAAGFDPALLGGVERDVTYCTAGAEALRMDIYYPDAAGGPAPVVINVHGGGWTQGNKDINAELSRTFDALSAAGFIVASIDYRLAPEFQFPAQIEDVKCAVRYLRASAGPYNLDPERIGAMGGSAGGHLVSLLGVTDGDEGLEGSGGYAEESSRVQAVVDMFGPSDLTVEFEGGAAGRRLGSQVFGTTDPNAPILKLASPVTHVSPDDPPFMIIQGDSDPLVPPSQSQALHDLLTAAGVDSTLVMVADAGHGLKPAGGEPSPSRAEIGAMIVEFFSEALK